MSLLPIRIKDEPTTRTSPNSDDYLLIDGLTGGTARILANLFQMAAGSFPWAQVSGNPTTLAGYGITDPIVVTSGAYANPSWITSLAWSKLTGTLPTSLAGVNSITSTAGQPLTIGTGTSGTALTIASATNAATFAGALTVTGHTTFEGVTSTGATGTGNLVYSASPTFTAPIINGLTSSGSTAIDFSGNSGAFKTTTGAATFGGSSNTFTNGLTAPSVTSAALANLVLHTGTSAKGVTFASATGFATFDSGMTVAGNTTINGQLVATNTKNAAITFSNTGLQILGPNTYIGTIAIDDALLSNNRTITFRPPDASNTYQLPAASATLIGSTDTGTVTNAMLAGSIANAKLTNSSVTIGSTSVSLGSTVSTFAGVTLTAPVINGGTATALTGLAIRSTGAAFDLTLASTEVFTAGRTLTLTLGDAARTLTLSGNPTLSGFTATGTGTLALGAKNLTISNTLTLAGTDATTITFQGTDTYVGRTTTDTLTNKTLSTSTAISAAVSYTAGVRQTFAPNGTTPGINVGSNAGDPSTPSNGDMWYNSTSNLFKVWSNGAAITISSSGTGTVTNTGGSLTANSLVLGAGSNDTKVVAGIVSDGVSVLTLGVAGTSVGGVVFKNATSGTITLNPATGALGSSVLTLPIATDTLVGKATTDTLTNKTLTSPTINGGTHTAITGLGIRSTGAAFDLTLASSEVLTAGRTLSLVVNDAARTLTIAGTASVNGTNTGDQTITLTGNVTGSGTGSFATTIASGVVTNAMLAGGITNANLANSSVTIGSTSVSLGATVATFAGVTLTAPTINGGTHTAITSFGLRSTGAAFDLTFATSEVLTAGRTLSIVMGDAARTLTLSGNPSLSGVTITGTGTLATTAAKTLTFSNSLTLAGTDATTMTFPASSATVAGLGISQTFTGIQTFSPTARTSGSAAYLTINAPADTTLTTGAECIGANFVGATRQFAGSTGFATQREWVFSASTYSFASATGTITTAITADFANPIQGTNASLTAKYSIRAVDVLFTGVIKAGSGPTTLTDSAGKILSAALNTVAIAQGGTGATTAAAANQALTVAAVALTETSNATTIDWSLGNSFTLTLNGNLNTVTFSNTVDGQCITVAILNTASNYTVTWGNSIKWATGSQPVQTIGAKTDIWTIIKMGSTYYGSVVQNF